MTGLNRSIRLISARRFYAICPPILHPQSAWTNTCILSPRHMAFTGSQTFSLTRSLCRSFRFLSRMSYTRNFLFAGSTRFPRCWTHRLYPLSTYHDYDCYVHTVGVTVVPLPSYLTFPCLGLPEYPSWLRPRVWRYSADRIVSLPAS